MPMPETISKGPILKRLEEKLSPSYSRRDKFLTDLKTKKKSLVQILVDHGVVKYPDEEAHLRNDWFDFTGLTSMEREKDVGGKQPNL